MLAYGYRKFGGPAVFEALTQPVIQPTGNQLVLETLAVNLNQQEQLERNGDDPNVTFPVIPGRDVVGRIIAMGPAVQDWSLGTVVAARTEHVYADQVCLDADLAVTVPDNVTPADAVSLITPGIIAHKTVRYYADIRPEQTVIVKGADTSVGLLTVQLAKRMGAHVIAVGVAASADTLTALGVDQFVSSDRQNPTHVLADQGDVVIDVDAATNAGKADLAMAKFDATIVSFAHRLPATSKSINFQSIQPTNVISDQATLQLLFKLLSTDQLVTTVAATFPLTLQGIVQAHEALERPHRGQLVVKK
ncbi:NADP-dependent oxidoreductase [Lactiplantibacillus modestisalitolerans]|uniref:NADP-dependent oxidoreductase n=1 Tax=Lactiplantibacillus modestisalitolerans TaxID=1457219 RepID=A0ABV5WQV1_9LACO|nr:NADP-dependent oxidoreductase [Lactiplantibacillus modestisalitolerans]